MRAFSFSPLAGVAILATEIAPVHVLVIVPGPDHGPVAGREFAEVDAVLGQGLVRAQARVDLVLARGLGVFVDIILIHGASLCIVVAPRI
jgi:hypothetical protein